MSPFNRFLLCYTNFISRTNSFKFPFIEHLPVINIFKKVVTRIFPQETQTVLLLLIGLSNAIFSKILKGKE